MNLFKENQRLRERLVTNAVEKYVLNIAGARGAPDSSYEVIADEAEHTLYGGK